MKKKSAVVPVLLTLLVIALGLGIFQVVRLYHQPMAKSLELPTATSDPAIMPGSALAGGSPTATVASTAADTCGNTGSVTLLFTGADFSGGVWPNGADSVRLIKVDYDAQTIKVIAFPRDLLVTTAGLADQNMPEQRLGLAYFYKKEATTGTDQDKIIAGTNLLAQTLYEDFAVRSDHYVTLQLDSVKDMIDTIGGVDITRSEAITSEHNVTFPAGEQTLSGELASEYVRFLNPGGEEARLERQNQFLQALQDKVISAGIIPQVPTLLEQFSKAIVTDLSPKQLVDLTCMVDKVGKDKIEFYEITGDELVSQGEAGALLPKVDAIKDLIQKAFELN